MTYAEHESALLTKKEVPINRIVGASENLGGKLSSKDFFKKNVLLILPEFRGRGHCPPPRPRPPFRFQRPWSKPKAGWILVCHLVSLSMMSQLLYHFFFAFLSRVRHMMHFFLLNRPLQFGQTFYELAFQFSIKSNYIKLHLSASFFFQRIIYLY